MNRIFKLKCSLFLGDRSMLRRIISGIIVLSLVPINIFFLNLALDTDSNVKYFIYNAIVSSIVCGTSIYVLEEPLNLYDGTDGTIHIISVVVIYFTVSFIYSKDLVNADFIQPNEEVMDPLGILSLTLCGAMGSLGNVVFVLLPGYFVSGIIRNIIK